MVPKSRKASAKQNKFVITLTKLTENTEEETHEKVSALRLDHNHYKWLLLGIPIIRVIPISPIF